MAAIRFGILLFLIFYFGSAFAAPHPANEGLIKWSQKLLQKKSVDTTEFYAFADSCILYNQKGVVINTYKALLGSGQKEIQPSDIYFLNELYKTIDTVHPAAEDFYIAYYLCRVFTVCHLDSVLPLHYAGVAYDIAKKINDDRLMIKGAYSYSSYYVNIRHDLLNGYKWIEEIEKIIKHANIDPVKEGVIDPNVGYSILYDYLEDHEKGIEYLNMSIAQAKKYNKYKQLFDLYRRRSFQELALNNNDAVLKTLDTAETIINKLPNNTKLRNYIKAQRFNAYEQSGRYTAALDQSKEVDLDHLKGGDDDYYEYLYRYIKLCLYLKQYDTAKQYIVIYTAQLKPWNILRLKNAYEVKYILSKETQNLHDALKFYEMYGLYNDSVHHQKNYALLIREQLRYQTLQKDEALKLERTENKLKSQTIKLIIAASFTVCLFLLLLLAYRINSSLQEKERLNRSFAKQLIHHTEQEQNRLANELHDGLGQELLLLKNSLLQRGDGKDADKVADIIESVRGTARELYPALLDVVGLKAAIESQLQKIDQMERIFVASELEYDGVINKESQLQLFRIFQEAVTNILKYANATSMYVGLKEKADKIILTIKDNGVGFSIAEKMNAAETFGLLSMQKRADAIKGVLTINSSVKGTEITITIPKDENNNS